METKAVAGYGGSVWVGTASSPLKEVADIGEWSGALALDAIEVPIFGQDRQRIPGKRDFSGSFSGNWAVSGDATGQKVLHDAITGGTTVYLKLKEKGGWYYCCYAIITGVPVGNAHDGSLTISFTFVSTGKISVLFSSV